MSSRALTYLLAAAFVAMGLLFFNHMVGLITPASTDQYLSPYDVRGMAVVHEGKTYTLNFDQQNRCVAIFNRAIPVGRIGDPQLQKPGFDKLVIYRFQAPDLELIPESLKEGALVFKVVEWNPSGYIAELSGGDLLHLLTSAYGP